MPNLNLPEDCAIPKEMHILCTSLSHFPGTIEKDFPKSTFLSLPSRDY